MVDLVRADIVSRLASIPDIGRVHAFQRFPRRKSKLNDDYVTDNCVLLGWHLTRIKVTEVSHGQKLNIRTTIWHITGYMAISEDNTSELVFDGLIDAISDKFRAWLSSDGKRTIDYRGEAGEQIGVALLEHYPCLFADTECHKAVLGLLARQFINQGSNANCAI